MFIMKTLDAGLRLISEFQRFLQHVVKVITTTPELQVWQTHDRKGHISWHAYEPKTGRSACFGSEEEIRVWIEMRYYVR
jgi:hypothetical protein